MAVVTAAPAATRSESRHPHRAVYGDVACYAAGAMAAGGLAAVSTLPSHRWWGVLATAGYAVVALAALVQLVVARRPTLEGRAAVRTSCMVTAWRARLAGLAWVLTAVVPMLVLAVNRAAGRTAVAQDEVYVVEAAGRRLWETGTPYLDAATITSLPAADQLAAYTPYQPGMALLALPRAITGDGTWWSDFRIWSAALALVALMAVLRLMPGSARARIRLWQAAAVAPPVTLAVAVGGVDVPVVALCLLGLALAGRHRFGPAGLAVGAACALKLIAWPVAVVLAVHAATKGRTRLRQFAVAAGSVAAAALLPPLLIDGRSLLEHTVLFPLGAGEVASPARTPLPGHLIATHLPGGRSVAVALLLAAALAVLVWLWRRPPRTAATAAAAAGCGLLAAIVLMPATRFGYVIHPLALLAWAWARQRDPQRRPAARLAS